MSQRELCTAVRQDIADATGIIGNLFRLTRASVCTTLYPPVLASYIPLSLWVLSLAAKPSTKVNSRASPFISTTNLTNYLTRKEKFSSYLADIPTGTGLKPSMILVLSNVLTLKHSQNFSTSYVNESKTERKRERVMTSTERIHLFSECLSQF